CEYLHRRSHLAGYGRSCGGDRKQVCATYHITPFRPSICGSEASIMPDMVGIAGVYRGTHSATGHRGRRCTRRRRGPTKDPSKGGSALLMDLAAFPHKPV